MPSEERNYYVLCDDNCRFPSMTYEQIIEAIAEATGNVPEHVEDAFITKVKESNHSGNLTFWKGTQAEFNALDVTAPVFKVGIDANGKLYFTPYSADDLTAHASRHASGGEDALTPDDIGAFPAAGGTINGNVTMGGNIDMDGHSVTGLPTPTNNSDAATKAFVENNSGGNGSKYTIVGFASDVLSGETVTKESLGNKNYIDVILEKPISLKKGNAVRLALLAFGTPKYTVSTSFASNFVYLSIYDDDSNELAYLYVERPTANNQTEYGQFAMKENLSFKNHEVGLTHSKNVGNQLGSITDEQIGVYGVTIRTGILGAYLGTDKVISKVRFTFSGITSTQNYLMTNAIAEIEIS